MNNCIILNFLNKQLFILNNNFLFNNIFSLKKYYFINNILFFKLHKFIILGKPYINNIVVLIRLYKYKNIKSASCIFKKRKRYKKLNIIKHNYYYGNIVKVYIIKNG